MAALSQVQRSPQEVRFLQEVGDSFSAELYEKQLQPSFALFIKQFQETQTSSKALSSVSTTSDGKEVTNLAKENMDLFWKMAGDKWQSYVVRKSGWSTNKDLNYGGMESQAVYGEWLHQTAQIAASCLKEKNWSFRQLESFCSLRRGQIAEMLNIPNAKQYGLFKDTNQWTPCHSGYADLRTHLLGIHESSKTVWTRGRTYSYYLPRDESKNIYPELIAKLKEANVPFEQGAYFAEINGKPVRLSEVLVCPTHPLESEEEKKYLYYDPAASHCVTVFHTKAKETKIQKILAHTEKIFDSVNIEQNPRLFIQELGKVYWWMCQCKPYFWGDPSIAETMIKAVAYSKGYEVPRWKENLIPWEQVMEHPSVEVFAERFYSFFDGDWVKK